MTGSSGYTDGELLQMQQDAIARVKEMQERARANITAQEGWTGSAPGSAPSQTEDSSGGQEPPPREESSRAEPSRGNPGSPENPPAPASSMPANPPPVREGGLAGLLGGASSSLGGLVELLGGDRIILIALIFLLLGEEDDPAMILSLCYLLLFD